MKFKYLTVVNGSTSNLIKYAQELEKIGYKGYYSGISNNYSIITNYNRPNYKNSNGKGSFKYYSDGLPYWKEKGVELTFDINNQWEFDAAVAVASIREGEKFYEGEYVRVVEGGWGCGQKDMGRIVKLYGKNKTPTIADYLFFEEREFAIHSVDGEFKCTDNKAFKKVEAKEIIEYFKNKIGYFIKNETMDNKLMGNRKIIGYNLNDLKLESAFLKLCVSGVSRGKLVGMDADMTCQSNINEFKRLGLLDVWFTPVYEEDSITILGHKAVKNGDNVKFGCQEFDIHELYSYKRLFNPELGGKIIIKDNYITEEVIDKLIKMLM